MLEKCIHSLYEMEAIKFGSFTLKSGIVSPIYIDLRVIISNPQLLKTIAQLMWEQVKDLEFEYLCGVPYTALPMATALSLAHDVPMVMRRKEAKNYGTKKLIEGRFEPGKNCLLIEDLITSGMSLFETIEPLEKVGLQIKDVMVFLDREQGGKARIESKGYRVHRVLTLSDLLSTLQNAGKVDPLTVQNVKTFIAENQVS